MISSSLSEWTVIVRDHCTLYFGYVAYVYWRKLSVFIGISGFTYIGRGIIESKLLKQPTSGFEVPTESGKEPHAISGKNINRKSDCHLRSKSFGIPDHDPISPLVGGMYFKISMSLFQNCMYKLAVDRKIFKYNYDTSHNWLFRCLLQIHYHVQILLIPTDSVQKDIYCKQPNIQKIFQQENYIE